MIASVQRKFPQWHEQAVCVTALAMGCYCKRPCDYTLRDHCLYIQLISGKDYVRSHDGVFHVFDKGAHLPYNGVFNETLLLHVQKTFRMAEGLLLLMSAGNPNLNSDEQFLEHAEK